MEGFDQGVILYKLGTVESTVVSINEKLDAFISANNKRSEDVERRLASLEKARIQIWTVAAIVAAIASMAKDFIMGIIH